MSLCGLLESLLMWPFILHQWRVWHAKLQNFMMHVHVSVLTLTIASDGFFLVFFASPFAHLLDGLCDVIDYVKKKI